GHQSRVEHRALVAPDAPRLPEAVDLGMGHGIALLDAAVVSAADDLAVFFEHRADGKPALEESLAGLGDGGFQERILSHSIILLKKRSVKEEMRDELQRDEGQRGKR